MAAAIGDGERGGSKMCERKANFLETGGDG